MSNMLSGVGSAIMFYLSGFDPIWVETVFATFTMPFFLMVLAGALGISPTSKNLPAIQLINLAAVAWTIYQISLRGGVIATRDYVTVGLALYGALTMQWYIHVFSNYRRTPSTAIVKGKALPELPLQRLDETRISSASFVGEKTLLVFFRTNWCPFCMNQLKEVKAKADQLAKAGVKVKFISNQGIENSQKLAKDLALPAHLENRRMQTVETSGLLVFEDNTQHKAQVANCCVFWDGPVKRGRHNIPPADDMRSACFEIATCEPHGEKC